MAVENMVRAPTRTASTVSALMIGLAFVFSTGAYIVSQKAAINRSLDRSLNCDIQVASSQQLQASSYHFSEAEVRRVLSLDGIAVADPIRVASVDIDGDTISVLAHDMNAYFSLAPDLLDTGDNASARRVTSSGQGVLISNNLAVRRGLRLGDPISLDTPNGSLELPVVGTVDYFRNEKGTIFIDNSVYEKYWNDSAADYIFIGLKKGVDKLEFKRKVSNALGSDRRAFVYTMDEFKQWVDSLVDQFFTLMYLQVVVAIFVAALSLANTMIISVDERRRELGIFRAIGGLRRQVVKLVLLEALAISLIGLFAGAVAGVFNAYYLVDTAVTAVSGYTIRLVFPHLVAWPAVPLVILIALAASLFPAIRASRLNVAEAIGYE
jgi:putative ABC transport system permease protein